MKKEDLKKMNEKELLDRVLDNCEIAYFQAFNNEKVRRKALEFVHKGIQELRRRKENENANFK